MARLSVSIESFIVPEKLRLMQRLWEIFRKTRPTFAPPGWQGDVLADCLRCRRDEFRSGNGMPPSSDFENDANKVPFLPEVERDLEIDAHC
jgi:hypothetical protein